MFWQTVQHLSAYRRRSEVFPASGSTGHDRLLEGIRLSRRVTRFSAPRLQWLGGCLDYEFMGNFLQRSQGLLRSFRDPLFLEVSAYISQTAIFCLVAIFMSNLLQDEKSLAELITSRIGANFWREIVCTILASLVWLGVLSVANACLPSSVWARVVRGSLNELPRTIYFFGSSVSGLLLAAAVTEWFHPGLRHFAYQFSGAALLWASVVFAYGFMLRLILDAGSKKQGDPP